MHNLPIDLHTCNFTHFHAISIIVEMDIYVCARSIGIVEMDIYISVVLLALWKCEIYVCRSIAIL